MLWSEGACRAKMQRESGPLRVHGPVSALYVPLAEDALS